MGACFDKPMVRVGTKTINKSRLSELKTYGDAVRIAGYECLPGASLTIVMDGSITFVPSYARFQIVDEIIHKQVHIPIVRLYGRR